MSTRRVLAAAGASALLLVGAVAMAAPSSAETKGVDALPANMKITAQDVISVNVLNAPVCTGTTGFVAIVAGRQDAVTLATTGVPNSAVCNGTTLSATVTPTSSAKKNAVVKFSATVTATGEKVVQTLVVHVDKGKPGKPGNSGNHGKPS
jgi:catabolite regulation protein CreA